MWAIHAVITGEQTLGFRRFQLRERLKPTEVLVKVDRTIISAGTELANFTGLDPDTRDRGKWCCYPWVPGYGGIGRVVEVGNAVKGLAAGDRVYGIYNHATHAVVDTAARLCVPVPASLDSTTAAFVRMGNVAITAMRRADATLGDPVAIIGLGLVGNLAGQFFARAGQRVIGIDPAANRRKLAETVGFEATLDPTGLEPEELLGRVQALVTPAAQIGKAPARPSAPASSPRVVVDAVGDSRLVEQAVRLAARNGQVIMLGTPRAPYVADMTPTLNDAHRRGIDIKGALEWNVPMLKRQAGGGPSTEGNAELILRMLARDELRVGALCTHVLPPAALNDAYLGLLHQKEAYMGVVLDWEQHPAPDPTLPDATGIWPRIPAHQRPIEEKTPDGARTTSGR
ncbi:MAG TPA: zinc-binding dehydrogenase [Armatimonadota bacterium]|nr:zinc-binding dehydrogenase [Armatimonadota bacterium]